VTKISTTPPKGGPVGTTAAISLSVTTMNKLAALEPKVTAVASLKPEPLIATRFPPATGPEVGLIVVTVGGGIVGQENQALGSDDLVA
jgi:predicted glycosyltransferase